MGNIVCRGRGAITRKVFRKGRAERRGERFASKYHSVLSRHIDMQVYGIKVLHNAGTEVSK